MQIRQISFIELHAKELEKKIIKYKDLKTMTQFGKNI